jgi:hypothetical protein
MNNTLNINVNSIYMDKRICLLLIPIWKTFAKLQKILATPFCLCHNSPHEVSGKPKYTQ